MGNRYPAAVSLPMDPSSQCPTSVPGFDATPLKEEPFAVVPLAQIPYGPG